MFETVPFPDPFGLAGIRAAAEATARMTRIMPRLPRFEVPRIPEAEVLAAFARASKLGELFAAIEPLPVLPPRCCCCGRSFHEES